MNRIEKDSLGDVKVKCENLWGAQTQRSYNNFKIGSEKMPYEIIESLCIIKKAACRVNYQLGLLSEEKAKIIENAIMQIESGEYKENFPLSVWQTGSGTHTNMNINEVIVNLGNKNHGYDLGSKELLHPNDDVNKGQSSNDTFPTAMHISIVKLVKSKLLDALNLVEKTTRKQSQKWSKIVKIGRTHLQDATNLTLGQEFSAFNSQIKHGIRRIKYGLKDLYYIAQGGSAVGTGINTGKNFDILIAKEISNITGLPFKTSSNKFESLSSSDVLVEFSGILNVIACSFMKIGNDIRLLSSGPNAGIGELILPANEPGSSIMPGKVNPTQIEALTMVCAQIMGNHVAVTVGGSNGHLQLNVFRPMIIYNILQSIHLLSDSLVSFNNNSLSGIKPNLENIKQNTKSSLSSLTALSKDIGYDKAAKMAKSFK